MEIRSDRHWVFGIGPQALWDVIARVDDYRSWWPWLQALEANDLVEGDIWRCVVQPPVPYILRFSIRLTEVDAPRHVSAAISGDVTGTASLEINERDNGCEARLLSAVAPGNGALRVVALFARPLARFGHDWVLDTGARQFVTRAV
jgi:hypothetical protein